MEGIERREVEKVSYTFALNDPSTCTSAILVVPKNCNVGLPRILSSANASGFSSRFSLDFPLGVDVTVGFPRSPETDGAESRVRVKLRPSRTMYESGSSSEPRYSRRWFVAVDVDAFDASVNILEFYGWSKVEAKGGQAPKCLAGECCSYGAGRRDCRRTTCPVADLTKCLTRSHDRVRRVNHDHTESTWTPLALGLRQLCRSKSRQICISLNDPLQVSAFFWVYGQVSGCPVRTDNLFLY